MSLFFFIFITTGLSAEIYYVRDGHVNKYALQFTVPILMNHKAAIQQQKDRTSISIGGS